MADVSPSRSSWSTGSRAPNVRLCGRNPTVWRAYLLVGFAVGSPGSQWMAWCFCHHAGCQSNPYSRYQDIWLCCSTRTVFLSSNDLLMTRLAAYQQRSVIIRAAGAVVTSLQWPSQPALSKGSTSAACPQVPTILSIWFPASQGFPCMFQLFKGPFSGQIPCFVMDASGVKRCQAGVFVR